ncbi:MAG: ABC transporter ATP-binding protein [Proteobacteria bacterium]|nr:ABC transporter ATP-binding protein [Pseudomonadota bacterium]MCP4920470.1 ABC transporter ATP-binding protein [Pseudomonadota bacterium]
MSALVIRDLVRTFGDVRAVDHVNFKVEPGEICGFIGPNGAGKTTTMRICSTLDLPDSGDVRVGGRSVLTHPRDVRRALGFMPDAYASEPNMPVSDYLDFQARAQGLRGPAKTKAIRDVVEFTGLAPLLKKDTTTLSKGMRQRAGLAVTLLHDPTLLILDEPAAGLDPRARVELRELLSLLANDLGKAVLISSHILTELSEICDVVAVIEQGRICASGRVEDIQRELRPHASYLLRALAEHDVLERFLAEQPGVRDVHGEATGIAFSVDDELAASRVLSAAVREGIQVVEFKSIEADLEEVFLSLTEGAIQ